MIGSSRRRGTFRMSHRRTWARTRSGKFKEWFDEDFERGRRRNVSSIVRWRFNEGALSVSTKFSRRIDGEEEICLVSSGGGSRKGIVVGISMPASIICQTGALEFASVCGVVSIVVSNPTSILPPNLQPCGVPQNLQATGGII